MPAVVVLDPYSYFQSGASSDVVISRVVFLGMQGLENEICVTGLVDAFHLKP